MRAPNYRFLKKQREETKRREQKERLAKRQSTRPEAPDQADQANEPGQAPATDTGNPETQV